MNKTSKKLLIDCVMFLLMMALAGTGLVRKYILLSGANSKMTYGYKVHMTLMGINRDGWGDIHLYLGFILLGLLLVHIVQHFKQMNTIFRRWFADDSARFLIAVVFIVLSLILLLFPFIVKPAIN